MQNSKVIGLGLIGYGGFGRFLRKSWEALDVVDLKAVSDANPRRYVDDLLFYSDWQALISDPTIELVAIATPPSTHADMACAAMRIGKHVLIEKPVATTLADAGRIRTVRDETRRVAGVDHMLRFNSIVEAIQGWARTMPFGPLRRVLVENYAQDEELAPGHWFWDVAVSGGILVEHAVHFIDLVNGCTTDRPTSVQGRALRRGRDLTDRMLLTVQYGEGLLMTQYHAFSRPGFFEDTTMRFVFDLAQVETTGWIPLEGTVRALVNDGTESALQLLPGLVIDRRTPVGAVEDVSRPQGSGIVDDGRGRNRIRSGGSTYDVSDRIEARFRLAEGKTEAYAGALRALLRDVAAAIQSPDCSLRVTLDDAIAGLEIALAASEDAGLYGRT